jgi:hypothetical protein
MYSVAVDMCIRYEDCIFLIALSEVDVSYSNRKPIDEYKTLARHRDT